MNLPVTVFQIKKNLIFESECLVNDKLTIYCEIEEYVIAAPITGKAFLSEIYLLMLKMMRSGIYFALVVILKVFELLEMLSVMKGRE